MEQTYLTIIVILMLCIMGLSAFIIFVIDPQLDRLQRANSELLRGELDEKEIRSIDS